VGLRAGATSCNLRCVLQCSGWGCVGMQGRWRWVILCFQIISTHPFHPSTASVIPPPFKHWTEEAHRLHRQAVSVECSLLFPSTFPLPHPVPPLNLILRGGCGNGNSGVYHCPELFFSSPGLIPPSSRPRRPFQASPRLITSAALPLHSSSSTAAAVHSPTQGVEPVYRTQSRPSPPPELPAATTTAAVNALNRQEQLSARAGEGE